MSEDPYFEVKNEVETTLHSLSTLHSSYHRILRTVPANQQTHSEELSWALAELKATLSAIEGDVDELDDSVLAVEEKGVAARLGISHAQVRERRAFVERVKRELATMRSSLPAPVSSSPDLARRRASAVPPSYFPPIGGHDDDFDNDDAQDDGDASYEMQHQTLLIEQQDRTLTDISGTVGLLREQAKVIGREVYDQNVLIEELDAHVDSTSNRLERAQRRMDRFIKSNKNSASSWTILILIIILSVLLFIIIFV